MPTQTAHNSDIVFSKNNNLYRNYSFNLAAQNELSAATTAIANLSNRVNNLSLGAGVAFKVVEESDDIEAPEQVYLTPALEEQKLLNYVRVIAGSVSTDINSPRTMFLLPAEYA